VKEKEGDKEAKEAIRERDAHEPPEERLRLHGERSINTGVILLNMSGVMMSSF